MRRRQAWLIPVALLLGGCTVAGPRLDNAEPRRADRDAPLRRMSGGMPAVRIGVTVDAPAVEVATSGEVELAEEGGRVRDRGAGPWTVTRSGDRLEVLGPSAAFSVPTALIVRSISGRVRVDGRAYYGAVLIRAAATGVTAVNLVDLETYLRGVVPLEIGAGRPSSELEAVKAQAVAARTFAVRQLGRRDALGFDYYATVADQAYGGADAEDPVATRAVEETRGQILVYRGEPIEAYYHSTCGGRTAGSEEVWSGEARPYLRSVSDRIPGGGWYCESSSRFRWTEVWSENALLRTLSAGLSGRGVAGPVTTVESIEVARRTSSGRAAELVIRTGGGVARIRGDSIRRVLRPTPDRILNSTSIELHPHGDGRVTGLTVDGAGWGHGVGMCQTGALGRARAGQSYREILSTYYAGTRLVRLYQ